MPRLTYLLAYLITLLVSRGAVCWCCWQECGRAPCS